jgi:hypothetical protein
MLKRYWGNLISVPTELLCNPNFTWSPDRCSRIHLIYSVTLLGDTVEVRVYVTHFPTCDIPLLHAEIKTVARLKPFPLEVFGVKVQGIPILHPRCSISIPQIASRHLSVVHGCFAVPYSAAGTAPTVSSAGSECEASISLPPVPALLLLSLRSHREHIMSELCRIFLWAFHAVIERRNISCGLLFVSHSRNSLFV